MSYLNDDLDTLAARLRALREQWGDETARAAFAQQAASLAAPDREHLAALIFGGVVSGDTLTAGDSTDSTVAIGAGASAGSTQGHVTVSGRVDGPVVGVNQGTVIQGAYNRIAHLDTLQIVVYTGPAQPRDAEALRSLAQAYRSEVVARYAVWRARYAPLPIQAQPRAAAHDDRLLYAVYAHHFGAQQRDAAVHTFTDLREGLERYGDLLLLGPPGGGKTTACWRLALDLAEAGLYRDPAAPLPVFVRLSGRTAARQSLLELAQADLASATLDDAAGARRLESHRQLAPLLPDLLASGQVLLLWDGLNEVPRALFADTAQALHTFRSAHPDHSLVSCRSDDYALLVEACGGRDPLPITQATVQGLDEAIVRQFIVRRLGEQRGATLLAAFAQPRHRALATLARTPLLLKLLCDVYDWNDALPENRGQLLGAFVDGRLAWEQARTDPAEWIPAEVQKAALARLAYAMTASRGRGTSVPWEWAANELQRAAPTDTPAPLRRLARQADLLEVLGDGQTLRFSHQLIQEYFAALALQQRIAAAVQRQQQPLLGWLGKRALRQFAAPGRRTGWEETLLLLAGIEGDGGHAQTLIRAFLSQPLQAGRLLLASGESVDPLLVDEVWRALAAIFHDPRRAATERVAAGEVLGTIGGAWRPVTPAAWRQELERRSERFGQPQGYWCYVRPGVYRIGGWKANEPSSEITLPAFWIARYPVTVAQYAPFVEQGYREAAKCWWTPEGWTWKTGNDRTQPWGWGESAYSGANQPVIGITWYEVAAFCAWLTDQLGDALPRGSIVRLPTEAEWEVAAAYDEQGQRRTYPWGEDDPTPERAIYDASNLGRPAPVGCCPAGAAACGALDMGGNVWEVTTSSHGGYPAQSGDLKEDFTPDEWDVPWRGGAWYNDSTSVRCGARVRLPPVLRFDFNSGFRVVFAPRSHKGSDF